MSVFRRYQLPVKLTMVVAYLLIVRMALSLWA